MIENIQFGLGQKIHYHKCIPLDIIMAVEWSSSPKGWPIINNIISNFE